MLLYLIRHADAVDDADDFMRVLSKKGEDQVRTLAKFLEGSEAFRPSEFWHSPLVRARQTAELLARRLDLKASLTAAKGLQPSDDPRAIVPRLGAAGQSLAIVGHEPHLSALASLLVAGAAEPPGFVMKKCALLALEGAGKQWAARWHVSPEILR